VGRVHQVAGHQHGRGARPPRPTSRSRVKTPNQVVRRVAEMAS
jgi:hypothetical protein